MSGRIKAERKVKYFINSTLKAMKQTENKTILRGKNIHKSFPMGRGTLDVLKGIDIELCEGEIIAIVGKSGVGKSTLLHVIGALDRPTSGDIEVDGINLLGMNDEELAWFRNKTMGFVFQFHHLMPEFTALENVMMPSLIGGKKGTEIEMRASKLLEAVDLSERLYHRPSELSGGELQRVAVARALINEPRILLADEPSGNLDTASSESLHDLMFDLVSNKNHVFLIVTHDMNLAARADRIVRIKNGVLESVEKEV